MACERQRCIEAMCPFCRVEQPDGADCNREPSLWAESGYVPNYGSVEAGTWLHGHGTTRYCEATPIRNLLAPPSQVEPLSGAPRSELMDIYSPPGSQVRFTGHGGYPIELAEALKILTPGEIYTVRRCEQLSSTTKVWLEEFPHEYFNSVQFEKVALAGDPLSADAPALLERAVLVEMSVEIRRLNAERDASEERLREVLRERDALRAQLCQTTCTCGHENHDHVCDKIGCNCVAFLRAALRATAPSPMRSGEDEPK